MNLQINLIYPWEQRSASVVNARSLLRIASITLPAIILCGVGIGTVRSLLLKNELNDAKASWEQYEPKEKKINELRGRIDVLKGVLGELDRFTLSRQLWSTGMTAIVELAPENVRISSFEISSNQIQEEVKVVKKAAPKRRGKKAVAPPPPPAKPIQMYTLTISGDGFGENANASIESFKNQLKEAKQYSSIVNETDIIEYAETSPTNIRFTIKVDYKGMPF